MANIKEIRICRLPAQDGTGKTPVNINYDPSSDQPCVGILGKATTSQASIERQVPREICERLIERDLCPRGFGLTPIERLQQRLPTISKG